MKKTFVLISMLLLWTGLNAQENEANSKNVDSRPDPKFPSVIQGN